MCARRDSPFGRDLHRSLSDEHVERTDEEGGGRTTCRRRLVSLRLSADVLEHSRATRLGWQMRIDESRSRSSKNILPPRNRKATFVILLSVKFGSLQASLCDGRNDRN
jgi:hypothetical protein